MNLRSRGTAASVQEEHLSAAKRWVALVAALAAACVVAPPSWGASTCTEGVGRAGLLDSNKVRAVKAVLTPLAAPEVVDGYATAWVGVGGTKRIRVGLRSSATSERSRLFYEVKRAGSPKLVLLDRWVEPGKAVSVRSGGFATIQASGRSTPTSAP